VKTYFTISFFLILTSLSAQKLQNFDLTQLLKQKNLEVVNRDITIVDSSAFNYIKVSEQKGEGIIWLPIIDFKNGTIEIEMRGNDVFQRSFVGITFHGQDDKTFDAVYCRPFNFISADSVRRIHAIQYVAHPDYTWKRLRDEHNALYEKEIKNPPNPNGWFKMTLIIKDKSIKAKINKSKRAALEIQKLSTYNIGKIGIFLGDGSGGDFRRVSVKQSK
jgi:hypothetical protein